MSRARALYGASPLHLLAALASFAIASYAFFQLFDNPTGLETAIWFVAAIAAHDLVAFPLYSALNLLAERTAGGSGSPGGTGAERGERAVPVINHLRIPAYLSAIALLLFFPLILGLSSANYEDDTGLRASVFLGRWFGICAVLFLGSALIYALRLRRARRLAGDPAETEAG